MEDWTQTARIGLITALSLLCAGAADAGIYTQCDLPQPAPIAWRGFLQDLRNARLAQSGKTSSLAKLYEGELRASGEQPSRIAEASGCYLRLGQPNDAIKLLRSTATRSTDNFIHLTHLGTAYQLLGDYVRAVDYLDAAIELVPAELREMEVLQRKLCQHRAKQKKPTETLDDLYGSTDPEGVAWPKPAVAQLQQLCLWFPTDAKLVWQLAEAVAASGDVRTASRLMDGAVSELALSSEVARTHWKKWKSQVELLERDEKHTSPAFQAVSLRAFGRRYDAAGLPKLSETRPNELPWALLDDTEIGKRYTVKLPGHLAELNGKTVAVHGFIQPQKADDFAEFALGENAIGCWFCDAPGVTQQVLVELKAGSTASNSRHYLTVTGKLSVNLSDPEQPLFRVTEATVKLVE